MKKNILYPKREMSPPEESVEPGFPGDACFFTCGAAPSLDGFLVLTHDYKEGGIPLLSKEL